MINSVRRAVRWVKKLMRGERSYNYEHLVTPKWARSHLRTENRFRRAMKRQHKPQIPILKRSKLAIYCRLYGSLPALTAAVTGLENASSFLRWMNAFTRRKSKQSFIARLMERRLIKKHSKLIKYTIEY